MFGFVSTPARAPSAVAPLDAALASLSVAVDAVRDAAASAPADVAITASLRGADLLTATSLSLLGEGGFGARVGMEPVAMLQLHARRTYTDARMLVEAASVLKAMPSTSARLSSGTLSYSEVRGIVCAARSVDAPGRAALDLLVGLAPHEIGAGDLLDRVDAEVAARRPDLVRAREDRAVSRGFLAVQGRLDGSSSFYGEADALSTATIVAALDARAALPVSAEDPDAPTRAQQRMDALIGICEDSLGGGPTPKGRPKPRFLVSLDLDAYAAGDTGAARLLWGLAGPAPRISPLSTEMLLCDADVVPVLFREGRPVGVGDAKGNIPVKLRRALIARDGRCRFPACRAAVSWTDVHHVIPQTKGRTDERGQLPAAVSNPPPRRASLRMEDHDRRARRGGLALPRVRGDEPARAARARVARTPGTRHPARTRRDFCARARRRGVIGRRTHPRWLRFGRRRRDRSRAVNADPTSPAVMRVPTTRSSDLLEGTSPTP